jgi:phospholipid/cholesterol/gamma-HCH transport system permease protein
MVSPIVAWLEALGSYVQLTIATVAWVFRPPFRLTNYIAHMEFIGVKSTFIVALTGTFSGMVLALQTVTSLRQYGAETNVSGIVSYSLVTEISPVFTALMVTARVGSSMAAELGNMRVTEQIDALATMAVSPIQYLLSPRLVAAVLMMPLLCIVYTSLGMVGTWLVAVNWLEVDPGIFIENADDFLELSNLVMGEVKAATFGFLVASLSCHQGYLVKGGSKGVGLATTRAVVQSAVLILISNYVITSWMTE